MHVDPKVSDRLYYRHIESGKRAYMVDRAGVQQLRLDGVEPEVIVKLDTKVWNVDRETRPLNSYAVAHCAFELDRTLCAKLALHAEAKKQWIDLTDEERIEFTKLGPLKGPPIRAKVWRSVVKALAEATGDSK